MSDLVHPQRALILGGGSTVWKDIQAWEAIYGKPWDGRVIVANDIGAHWPGEIDVWVSLHANKIAKWQELRAANGHAGSRAYETWGKVGHGAFAQHTVIPWAGGSSGMLAVQVARDIGCTRAVLCGIPMTATAHFQESKENFQRVWAACNAHWKVWPRHADKMLGWVKSMSGRTRELLGPPTLAWLLEEK